MFSCRHRDRKCGGLHGDNRRQGNSRNSESMNSWIERHTGLHMEIFPRIKYSPPLLIQRKLNFIWLGKRDNGMELNLQSFSGIFQA
jgi:hypothetical protein